MIYIVIPVFNRLALTIDCLNSLLQQEYKAFTIIVVDDGSTDGTAAHLEQLYPMVQLIKGDGNWWWTGATNAGVKKALELSRSPQDFVLTLNNDLVVKEDYLRCLFEAAGCNQRCLIGSVSVDIRQPDKIQFAGTKWNRVTAKYRPGQGRKTSLETLKVTASTVATDLLPGRGVLIPIGLFNEIGLYDRFDFPHYMADEDFSLRATQMMYGLLVSTRAIVYRDTLFSIRSPANTRNRWNWAKRHARSPASLYFLIDMARICKSLLFKS
jgi:GT2 family glycosyltransferase